MSASFEKGEKEEFQVSVQDAKESLYRRPSEKEVQACRPCRLCIVGTFVLLLIGLLVASIVLIALTDKCKQPVTPPDVDTSLSYQLDVGTFNDSDGDGNGDFNGTLNRLSYLQELGVNTVILSGVVSQENFQLANGIGTLDDMKRVLQAFESKNMKVILQFEPSFVFSTSLWFQQSMNGTSKRDWFVWKPSNVTNNWLDFSGNSAWHESDDGLKNNETFYSFYDKTSPMLNYNNADVLEIMLEILNNFLDMGVDGFFFPMVSRLALDSQLRNNTKTVKYDQDTDKTHEILQRFYKTISTKDDGMLYVTPNTKMVHHLSYLGSRETREADVVFDNSLATMNKIDVSVLKNLLTTLGNSTLSYLNIGWQTGSYEYLGLVQRVANVQQGRAFVLFSLLLPQAVQMVSGDEALVKSAVDLATAKPVANFADVSKLRTTLAVFHFIPRVVFAENDSIVLVYDNKIVVGANFGGVAVNINNVTSLVGKGKYVFHSDKSLIDSDIDFSKSFELKSYDVVVIQLT